MDILTVAAEGAQPVSQEIKEQLLTQFIEAVLMTFSEMVGIEVAAKEVFRKEVDTTLGEISVALPVFGPEICDMIPVDSTVGEEESVALCLAGSAGSLVLGFLTETATAIAEHVLAGIPERTEADLQYDCLGEIANVIAGQAKALLADTPYRFTFSTPQVIIGSQQEIWLRPDRMCFIVVFGCKLGNFALQLLLWP